MADISDVRLDRNKQAAIETFLTGLVTGSKTVSLYRSGHSIIPQICERVLNLLTAALGQDTNLTLDVKAKNILVNDVQLNESGDINSFAATLHTLGIGQVLFTNRLTKDGLYEFFKLLVLKADEKTSLTDIQKSIQGVRIDGMQLSFILAFVVTGETAPADQPPGQLSEEQIRAFIAARTLPDFLGLLLKQNEPLVGKAAEAVTGHLDAVLNRELSIEKFQEAMAWDAYDPRIRARWDEFARGASWTPRPRGMGAAQGRQRWTRDRAISEASVFLDADLAAVQDHHAHEKRDAVRHALDLLHQLLEGGGERRQKYAIFAYTRLLAELGRDGNVARLLTEFDVVRRLSALAEMKLPMEALRKQVQEKVPSEVFASRLVEHLGEVAKDSDEFKKIAEFLLFLGDGVPPLLLEELRRLQDKNNRAKLCALLTTLARTLGTDALTAALKDDDWFLVSNIVGILGDLGAPGNAEALAPMLTHAHERVREATRRVLGKLGGTAALDALANFMIAGEELEEVKQTITVISLMSQEGVDAKLVEAYRLSTDYDTQVAIVSVLGRIGTPPVEALLTELARWGFWERITGRNRELRVAARQSLAEVHKEKKNGAAS